MATPGIAANAYASLARLTDPTGAAKSVGAAAGVGDGAPNFSALLKNAVSSLNQVTRNTDAQTQAAATGKSNIVDVVTAVAETEVAIDALVAVRDRVIQAYEEIMKMPI